jgi:hypothetical protein
MDCLNTFLKAASCTGEKPAAGTFIAKYNRIKGLCCMNKAQEIVSKKKNRCKKKESGGLLFMPKQKKSLRQPVSKRSRYNVKNWNEYNRSLKKRGRITLWMSEDVIAQWYHQGKKKKGGQFKYSDKCIEACCMVRKVYCLALRQTEGFVQSIIGQIQYHLLRRRYCICH